MSKARTLWILTLFFASVPSAFAQDDSAGPLSRLFNRNRQTTVPHHHHHHVQAQPVAVQPSYDYTYTSDSTYAPMQPAVEVAAEPVAPSAETIAQETAVEPAPAQVEPAPIQVQQVAETVPAYGYETGSDPYGFTHVLNRIRAAAGLHPLAYDPGLSSWAHQNNAEQCRLGLGHHVNPTGTQNCAYNYTDADSTAAGWMNSPGHRQNMLSPTATSFGIAFGPGPYWTLNAR